MLVGQHAEVIVRDESVADDSSIRQNQRLVALEVASPTGPAPSRERALYRDLELDLMVS
jgi:hypothetical protein